MYTPEEIQQLETALQKGEITTDKFYRDLAFRDVAERHFNINTDLILILVASGVGYAIFGGLGALLVGLVVSNRTWNKVSQGNQAIAHIKQGNFAQYLPDGHKQDFESAKVLPAAKSEASIADAPKVGRYTKLNAVEAPAKPVDEATQALEPIFDLPDEPKPETNAIATAVRPAAAVTADLVEMMSRQLKSTIIAAPPRTGKGILVANAGRRLLKYRPDVEVWLVDPKDEPSEAHYWSFVDLDKRLHFDLRDFSIDIPRVEGLLEEFQQRFNASTAATKLLIVDEFVSLNKMLDSKVMGLLKSRLVAISSSGETGSDGKGRFTWIVTQSPNATDIGFGTKSLRSSFSSALLFSSQTVSIIDSAVGTGFCPKLETAVRHKLLASTGRAFYYSQGDKWAALPEYETEFPSSEISKLSHPFSYQQDDEYQKGQFSFNANECDLEALLSVFSEDINESQNESNDLPDEAIAIHEYALKQPDEWVKVRDIQRASLSALKGCGVEQIRELILLLEKHHKGDADDDNPTAYKPFK
jgi:hypothetical protein